MLTSHDIAKILASSELYHLVGNVQFLISEVWEFNM